MAKIMSEHNAAKKAAFQRIEMIFDYFYKEQSEQYAFYRIPKVLILDEEFAGFIYRCKAVIWLAVR